MRAACKPVRHIEAEQGRRGAVRSEANGGSRRQAKALAMQCRSAK